MLFIESPMLWGTTDNEVNNLVYLLFKFTFNIDNPENSDIAAVMKKIGTNKTKDKIIGETVEFIRSKFGEHKINDFGNIVKHANAVYEQFFQSPYHLRNNLGEDSEADEFITKH